MPNGGPDCCGNCGFNRAVQEMGHCHLQRPQEFWDTSHCTLRDLRIRDPFWTYCDNFRHGKVLPSADEKEEIQGPVFGGGLEGGYARIPWNGPNAPQVSVPAVCVVCQRETEKGIAVAHQGQMLGFCSNRHYVDWWNAIHDDPRITSEGLEVPEE